MGLEFFGLTPMLTPTDFGNGWIAVVGIPYPNGPHRALAYFLFALVSYVVGQTRLLIIVTTMPATQSIS
jgi:hypothetical protein